MIALWGVFVTASVLCFATSSVGETASPLTLQLANYRNLPIRTAPKSDFSTFRPTDQDPRKYLLHEAAPTGNDAVIGLAVYRGNMRAFRRIVGSLRHFGYTGHIILGVSPEITVEELTYLKEREVTMYAVHVSPCIGAGNETQKGGLVRGSCSADIPDLKLEWGRFEMARRWLLVCMGCTGWSMVMDTRDIFFQDHPVSAVFHLSFFLTARL